MEIKNKIKHLVTLDLGDSGTAPLGATSHHVQIDLTNVNQKYTYKLVGKNFPVGSVVKNFAVDGDAVNILGGREIPADSWDLDTILASFNQQLVGPITIRDAANRIEFDVVFDTALAADTDLVVQALPISYMK